MRAVRTATDVARNDRRAHTTLRQIIVARYSHLRRGWLSFLLQAGGSSDALSFSRKLANINL